MPKLNQIHSNKTKILQQNPKKKKKLQQTHHRHNGTPTAPHEIHHHLKPITELSQTRSKKTKTPKNFLSKQTRKKKRVNGINKQNSMKRETQQIKVHLKI